MFKKALTTDFEVIGVKTSFPLPDHIKNINSFSNTISKVVFAV